MKRNIAFLLTAAILLPLLAGLTGCSGDKTGKSSIYKLSPENSTVNTDMGISVSLGNYVLDKETELVITQRPTEEDAEAGYKIEAYDFTLGEMTDLDDFITIRIPYDDTYREAGQDASLCVGAKYSMKLPAAGKTFFLKWIRTAKSLLSIPTTFRYLAHFT